MDGSGADVPESMGRATHSSDDASMDTNAQHRTHRDLDNNLSESQTTRDILHTYNSGVSHESHESITDEQAGQNNEALGRFDYPLPPLPDSQSEDDEPVSQESEQDGPEDETSERGGDGENTHGDTLSSTTPTTELAQSQEPVDSPVARSELPMRRSSAGGSLYHSSLNARRGSQVAADEVSDEMERTTLHSDSAPSAPRRVSFGATSPNSTTRPSPRERTTSQEFGLPRWQPDAEVTYCPICHAQFSIFVRKHHCRKCGRVVCNSCSPHRIIIPHQYIVRPPGSEYSLAPNLFIDGLGAGYVDVNGASGGERVRLCNPCVPDPNTAPPQSPSGSGLSSRSPHQRSRSTLSGTFGASNVAHYGALPSGRQAIDPRGNRASRTRSITVIGPSDPESATQSTTIGRTSMSYQTSLERFLAMGPPGSSSTSRHRGRLASDSTSSSRQRALPPTPQIAEEDECPICHHELPARTLPDFEVLREAHINSCILSHSTYGSPRGGDVDAARSVAPRRTGMYTYMATEKDCVDDAECTICLEEYQVNDPMCRLECLCRFHRSCITLWFVKHPGRCPVHQHDGFGF